MASISFWVYNFISGWHLKHNNVIPNGHFRKHGRQNYVKTWFNLPARKTRRRIAGQKKAVKIFPRPTAGPLRPMVHGQTLKYNMKVRADKGFSLEELKGVGTVVNTCITFGVSWWHLTTIAGICDESKLPAGSPPLTCSNYSDKSPSKDAH